jgi:hypothetical protein
MRGLLPLLAALLLLSGCSVIQTITGIPSQAQNAADAEIVVVTDELIDSSMSPLVTLTPSLETTPPAKQAAAATVKPATTSLPVNAGISPTTGRQLPEGAAYRPVLVAIDNAALARPQTALMLADIVYEFPLDRTDHSTRYLALFSDALPDRVGPVRTSRAYLAETALEWGGLYVSLGDPELAAEGYPLLEDSGILLRVENADDAETYFYRDKTISALEEHTHFFQLQSYVENHTPFSAKINETRFSFERGVTYEKGKEIRSVGLPFTSSDVERVLFTYDQAENVFIRSDKNSKKVLGVSKSLTPTDDILGYVNDTITVQNLIVQFVRVSSLDSNYRSIILTGKGDCMYFVNGRAVFGNWSRPTLDDPTAYTLYDGSILRLEPGNTWIMMIPGTREIKIRYVG